MNTNIPAKFLRVDEEEASAGGNEDITKITGPIIIYGIVLGLNIDADSADTATFTTRDGSSTILTMRAGDRDFAWMEIPFLAQDGIDFSFSASGHSVTIFYSQLGH